MKKIALILAGGVGNRFGENIPKQFVKINDKPIMIYTLQTFQEAANIDEIVIVCVMGWLDHIKQLCEEYSIKKVRMIVLGGESRFLSIYNGIQEIAQNCSQEDFIIIHDAVRPCINDDILTESIQTAKKIGAAVAVASCYDTMFVSKDSKSIDDIYPREFLYKGQTPETIRFGIAKESYDLAYQDSSLQIDSPTSLLMRFGKKVGLSKGSQSNIKVTTQDDVILFKAMIMNK